MSFLSTLETCFVVVASLTLFLGKSVVELSLGLLVFSFVLHLASYNSVSIVVVSAALSSRVSHVRLEVFLLVIPLPKSVVNARG